MKKCTLFTSIIFSLLFLQLKSLAYNETFDINNQYPWVPRVSAYEAYVKYKDGKALIFHSGGMKYTNKHIVGALNLDLKPIEPILKKFPKNGIEIFTYCY